MQDPARWRTVAELLAQVSAEFTAIVDKNLGTDWAENPEILALLTLRLHPAPTTSQIGERSGLDRRAVSRLVNRLRHDGLVVTGRSPLDHRAISVTLTEHGRSCFETLAYDFDAYFDAARSTAEHILAHLACGPAPNVSPTADALTLLEQLARVGSELVADLPAPSPSHPLSGRQRVALVRIVTGESVRPVDLAATLDANPSTITYVINQLVAKGLVSRHQGVSDDGRAVVLMATESGQHATSGLDRAIQAKTPELCSAFTAVARRRQPSADNTLTGVSLA